MRQRIEDLGRICEMLDKILDHSAFSEVGMRYCSNNKFTQRYADAEQLEGLEIGLEDLKSQLSECWCLARWGDKEH